MSGRKVEEWKGRTPDTPIPDRVKLRIWIREGGRCHLTGKKIDAQKDSYEFEHCPALSCGGENRESKIFLALKESHKKKTAKDKATKAKIDRIIKKNAGIGKKKSKIPYRKFDGTPVWPERR